MERVKITLDDIQTMVTESVKRVLKENFYMDANSPEEFSFLWNELSKNYVDDEKQSDDAVFCSTLFTLLNKDKKSFGKKTFNLVKRYYTDSKFRSTIDKFINNIRGQLMGVNYGKA